ncbi:hypothetical protein JHK87_055804 [Glycine soja]|nr:hypothetical protein JHK87_055804 [Glycine soja]
MEGYEPTLIIIDQHLTTKVAIDKIFNSYAHRFCMRHIMKKNSEIVGVSLNVNKKFYNHFKSCVWGLETQNDFESTWKAIMVRFKLEKNDWLSHMCMDKAEQHKEKLLLVMNGVVNIEKQLAEYERDSKQTKTDDLETFVGSSIPKEVGILPPQFSKTKGSGKRIKSGKEKVIEQQQKKITTL